MSLRYYIMYKSKEPLQLSTASDFARCCAQGLVIAYMITDTYHQREGWEVVEVHAEGYVKKPDRTLRIVQDLTTTPPASE